MTDKLGRAYVGTSGWKKPQWRGRFYPKGLVQRRELEFASRQLTSLEINSTFHGLQRPSTFVNWREETPADFVFAVKGYKAVTQAPTFRNAHTTLTDFFASGVLELRQKLGPILWQLPGGNRFDVDNLRRFLELLPTSVAEAAYLARQSATNYTQTGALEDRPIRHSIEARDPSYLTAEYVELLRSRGIALVFTNTPDTPDFRELTADFAYLRLSSGNDHFAEGYDDATLRRYASDIDGWVASGRNVFTYFKNPAGLLTHTPHNAIKLLRMIEGDGRESITYPLRAPK